MKWILWSLEAGETGLLSDFYSFYVIEAEIGLDCKD